MPKKAVIYARQSTDIQQSIPAQISALKDWIKTNTDAIVINEFKDVLSGKNADRPGLEDLKNYILEFKVDLVVVWRYDRLARNLTDLAEFLEFCTNLDIKVISITEPLSQEDNSFAMNTFQISVLGAWAEYQRKVIKENQHIGFQQKYNEGHILSSQVPYGYRLVDGILIIEESEAEIVKIIFNQYSEGFGYSKIADSLNSNGLFNRDNKRWVVARLSAILRNDFYTGQITSKYGTKNTHDKPLISKTLFENVQSIRESKQVSNEWVTRRYILRKKIICPYCGCVCTPQHTVNNDKIYYYYRCAKATSDGTNHCKGINLNAIDIEQEAIRRIRDFIHSTVLVTKIREQIEIKNKALIHENKKKEERIQTRQEKILQRYENGHLTDDELYEALHNLNRRKEHINLKQLIPESIVELLDTELEVDVNPTVSHYILYQEIIDEIQVNENKEITAIYLSNFSYDILKMEV